MRRALILLFVLSLPISSAAAQRRIAEVAREARDAVRRGDLQSLLAGSRGLHLRLPGVEPSSALSAPQATATIRDLFRRGETTDVTVEGFRDVGGGRAFVELRRAYRLPGSPELRVQRILLSYRQTVSGWELVEFRAG